MIAIDTSSFSRFLQNESGPDTALVAEALRDDTAYVAPIVRTELLSRPELTASGKGVVLAVPLLEIRDGYWDRAGQLRRNLLSAGLKAKLADCLIAQSCIDHDVPLITYDRDFRHFAKAGLMLA